MTEKVGVPAAGAPLLGGAQAWLVWIVAVAFVIFLFSFQTGYSVVNPSIQKDLSLSVAQVGLVAAIYTWSFAIFQLFSGALLDRLGARRVLPVAVALVTIGVFIFASASSVTTVAVAQLVLALGACAGFVGAGYVGGQWFGFAKFSFMFGLVQSLASLFSAFGQNLFGFALKYLEWRELFMTIGVLGIVLFFIMLLFVRDPVPLPGLRLGREMGKFIGDVLRYILGVAKIGHVWIAALYGALIFGVLLAAGVVWAPKLMLIRGLSPDTANLASSALWLGLAAGCAVVPWSSDYLKRRKPSVLAGIALQLLSLLALLYVPNLGTPVLIALWIAFGIGAASHMLAFSAAADVVRPEQIGTSAAIVNGTMFLASGVLIARPGQIASGLLASGEATTLATAATAARPFVVALVGAFVLAFLIRESYPRPAAKS